MRKLSRGGVWLLILIPVMAAGSRAGQAPTAADAAGTKLLERLVVVLVKAVSPGGPGDVERQVIQMAADLKTMREAGKADDVFAARFSRLLTVVRQAVNPDPQTLEWPMMRFLMMDFIEQATGRMPEWKDVLANIEHHGGPGIGLAMLADAVLSEVVSLHIHLRTLSERPLILKSYMEKGMAASAPSPEARMSR